MTTSKMYRWVSYLDLGQTFKFRIHFNFIFRGVGSFLDQSVRIAQTNPARKDMSRTFRDSATQSPGSLFKSSAVASIQQPEEPSKSRFQMEQSFNSSAKTLQITELDNISTYLRLDHVRNQEQNRKVVPRFATAEIVLSRSLLRNKCDVISDAALFHIDNRE